MIAPSIIPRAGGPGWADAGVVVPWILYERYDDVRLLERHYTSMLDYIEFLDRASRTRTVGTWLGFGDWVSPDGMPHYIDGSEWTTVSVAPPRLHLVCL